MFKNKKRGFTLIELLVVIAIIGILATLAVVALQQARQNARDSKRVADMKQIHTALELFFNENSRYPSSEEWESGVITSSVSGEILMHKIPTAPTPADGTCSDSDYQYAPSSDGSSYQISFCTGKQIADLNEGAKCLTPGGMIDGDCGASGVLACSASTPAGSSCLYGGDEYRTVQIGSQIWFKDALKTIKYNDGTDIESGDLAWQSEMPAYSWYDNDLNYREILGALYNWHAVDTGKLCPIGWHVPSNIEWDTMINYVIDNTDAEVSTVARWLKSCRQLSGINSAVNCLQCLSTDICPSSDNSSWVYNDNHYGIDAYNFSWIPSGARFGDNFNFIGVSGTFWSSSPGDPGDAWYYQAVSGGSQINKNHSTVAVGFSVRCVKN